MKNYKITKRGLIAKILLPTAMVGAISLAGCGEEENSSEVSSELDTSHVEELKEDQSANTTSSIKLEEGVEVASNTNKTADTNDKAKKSNYIELDKVVKDAYLRESFLLYLNGNTEDDRYDNEKNADALGYVITYLGKYSLNIKKKFLKLSDYVKSSRTAHQLELIEKKLITICKSKNINELEKNYSSLEKLLEALDPKDGQMVIGDAARRKYKEVYAPMVMIKAGKLGDIELIEKVDEYTRDAKINYLNNGEIDTLGTDTSSTYDEEVEYNCGKTK